ncbi:lysophospholipid acyltransferase family protein [Formosa maritima]|uniref:Lysophospholipid acyltransferase family protein n=1 Tax=Formosa maritima TaxID=2592046 RepID=A0A5D0GEK4_9FLAO|nr:lysophospholipid acyltransferase family protein [Formosa maritima]TYA57346.1 lysophospholipid acyltransferase family protein [Formosa maritima]
MQFLAYILIYPFLWGISILPFRILYFFSDGIYILIYYIIGYRRRTVKENLNLVFPDKSEKEIKTITKKFYHHLCDMVVESIKSMTISETEIKKRFVYKNVDQILDLEKDNKSIVLMCGHYASWEWIFILQKYINHKGYAIYKRLANKYFDTLVKRIRAKYNSYLITTKETIPVLIKAKVEGELTINGFASDQSPKNNKALHWQEFMNIKVPVHTGAEMLAKRLDMAVVFLKVKKLKRGYYEATISTITKSPKDYKDYEITDIFLKLLEEQIYEAPEYYLWTHKRWKHRNKVPEKFK